MAQTRYARCKVARNRRVRARRQELFTRCVVTRRPCYDEMPVYAVANKSASCHALYAITLLILPSMSPAPYVDSGATLHVTRHCRCAPRRHDSDFSRRALFTSYKSERRYSHAHARYVTYVPYTPYASLFSRGRLVARCYVMRITLEED